MAAEIFTDASRALDANANPYAGAKLYFYATGTTTPQAVYTTAALNVAHTNPVVADSGGQFPAIYFDATKQYRGILKNSTESVTMYDIDPINPGVLAELASSTGAAQIGKGETNLAVIARVTPQEYGAVGDGVTNDTTAIQATIDSGAKEVFFPQANYLHGNLTCDNDYQRFVGPGAKLVRNANSTTITVSARGNQFHGLRFSGGSFTGNNLTINGPETCFINCDSIETQGRALLAEDDGGNLFINGGVWNTTDTAGYEIELKDTTPGTSLYSKIIGISTNQAGGGILLNGQGTVRVIGCQIGKLTIQNGSGGMYEGNRFNGAVSVQASTNQFSNNAYASTVTFGDGVSSNIGQIAFDSTNIMQASGTLTINSNVVESTFHLGAIQSAGATLVINGPNNDIWHSELSYTPTLSAGGGSPTVGDGTLIGKYSRQGRQWTASVSFSFGSTSSFGSGDVTFTAPYKAKSKAVGSVRITDAGTGHFTGICEIDANGQTVKFFAGAGSSVVGTPVRASVPMTWASGDSMAFSISGEYVA